MTRTIAGDDFVTIASFINNQASVPVEVIDAITRVAEAEWCVGCGISQACDQCQMDAASEQGEDDYMVREEAPWTPEDFHEADGETYDKVCDTVCDHCGCMASSDDLVAFYGEEYFEYYHAQCGEARGLRRLTIQSLA